MRKLATEKRDIINYWERRFPILVSLCIKLCIITRPIWAIILLLVVAYDYTRTYQVLSTKLRHLGTPGDNLDKIIRVHCRNQFL